jgi:hypothetical protein
MDQASVNGRPDNTDPAPGWPSFQPAQVAQYSTGAHSLLAGDKAAACSAASSAGRATLAGRVPGTRFNAHARPSGCARGVVASSASKGTVPDWRRAERYVHAVVVHGSAADVTFGGLSTRAFDFVLARYRARWGVSIEVERAVGKL